MPTYAIMLPAYLLVNMYNTEAGRPETIYRVIEQIIYVAYLLILPSIGILVACIGFCDPDTCWHLALGQWMLTHQGLPYVDPFSSNVANFVFVAKNLPLIQHEWLTDIVFYGLFSAFGLTGLLVLTAILSVCSFVIIPSILMLRNGVPRIIVLAAITLVICASSFRLWVRPDEFSFLFMSLLILLNDIVQTTTSQKKMWTCSILIFVIMALWANCHGLFVIGLAYLAGYSLLAILQSFWLKSTMQIRSAAIVLIAAVTGTFCTPWYFHLWIYVCKMLRSPIIQSNRENGHMTLSDLSNPTFIPLCLLLVLVWGILLWIVYRPLVDSLKSLQSLIIGIVGAGCSGREAYELCRAGAAESKNIDSPPTFSMRYPPAMLLPFALSLGATVAIIAYRRITPFALLVIFAALSKAFQASKITEHQKPYGWANALISLCTAGLTCYLTAACFVPPCLPTTSRLFNPPYKAIKYLQLHQPLGCLLNDCKFGSMMEWNMKNPPDIFIDGRFETDPQLVYDYNTMRLCHDNWRQLLDRYKISWLFFPPQMPVVRQLSADTQWRTIYSDQSAVILCR